MNPYYSLLCVPGVPGGVQIIIIIIFIILQQHCIIIYIYYLVLYIHIYIVQLDTFLDTGDG